MRVNPEKIQHSMDVIRLAAKISRQYYGEPLIITYSGGKEVFDWWMESPVIPGQISIFDEESNEN